MDIQELEDGYMIQADIPGVEPKGIEIRMENGVLEITIPLPAEVDESRAKASCRNGGLQLSLPKSPAAVARRTEVNKD